ncbi:MAG: hypothetical protein JXP34_26935 [Planctomycetes bacterium]|nr:hypothetical protein [Planctomycetota bacterium]
MKKLLVFLGIFTFVLGVFLIVTGQFAPGPDPGEQEPAGASAPAAETGSFVRYPYHDAERGGRLAVEFSGNVVGTPDLMSLAGSRPESLKLQLRNGRVRVPLYANSQAMEPGVKVGSNTVREFVFEFDQAEGAFSRGDQTIFIHRGGRGRADDGTLLEFDELQLSSSPDSTWRASCGKRALLRREAIEIRAERGFVAVIDAAGLRTVEFQPPVRTFFLPGSEGLPFAVLPPVGGTSSRDGAGAEADTAVCVRCAGPLSIDREAATIRYNREVEIFPVDTLEEGLLEKLPPTHARCEILTLRMDLGAKTLRGATAERGPNTPVQAFRADDQGGFNIEGDHLEWEHGAGGTGPLTHGVTTLTGTPRMWGENWEVASGRIRLDLDAGMADFEDRVRGWFTGPERVAEAVEGTQEQLPAANVWDFQAQTAKAEFRKPPAGEPFRLALDRITAYGAEGGEAGGIEVRSRDKVPVIAYGPILRCTFQERQIRTISMDSSLSVRPRFSYGQSWLTAGRVVLLEDEGAAVLENDVRASIDAQAEGTTGPAAGPAAQHEIRADKARVTLVTAGGSRQLVIEGWGSPERELTMKIAGDPIFRLYGEHLRWEQGTKIAILSGETRPQRLELYLGDLEASTLRFDQANRTARADGKVRIRFRETAQTRPLSMSADHLEVDLREPEAAAEAIAAAAQPVPASGPATDPRPAAKDGGEGDPAERIQSQLGQVRSASAWVDDPAAGGVVVEGEGFQGTSERADWDGRKRILRFSGRGVQSLVLERSPGRRDEIQAAEVICDWAANRIHLMGNVHGILYLDNNLRRRSSGIGAAAPAQADRGIPLAYQADQVEVEVVPRDGSYDLVQLVATRHVQVENQSYQLKLSGHRLMYDAVRQFVVIDAPAEESSPDLTRGGPEACRVTAREMRVWRQASDDPADRTSPGKLAVTFDRDVSMYLTLEGELGASAGLRPQKVIIAAERMTFLFDPSQGASPQSSLIEARAEGNVTFSSGRYQGGAERAVYEGPRRRLVLLGTRDAPAHLFTPLPPTQPATHRAPVITLRNIGSSVLDVDTRGGYEWKELELPWQQSRIRVPSAATGGTGR